MNKRPEVCVAGMGCVTPLGATLAETWPRLLAGESSQSRVTLFDVEHLPFQEACWCHELPEWPGSRNSKTRIPRTMRLAIPAALEALSQAGLDHPSQNRQLSQTALVLGGSGACLESSAHFLRALHSPTPRKARRAVSYLSSDSQLKIIQRKLGINGLAHYLANSCASGSDAIGLGASMIRAGLAETVLAGGMEPLSEFIFSGFARLSAICQTQCRPFDRGRDGMIPGEGAGFVVLESKEAMLKRGAKPLVLLSGYGQTLDTHHLAHPHPTGRSLVKAMQLACEEAHMDPSEVCYVNAHGTGTPANDPAEASAYQTFFGTSFQQIKVSSTKATVGHAIAAAGVLEAIFTVQTLLTGSPPPQMHCRDPIEEMVGRLVQPGDVIDNKRPALSVNLGICGANSALLFKRDEN